MLWLIVVIFCIAAKVHAFSMKMSNDLTNISRRAAIQSITLASSFLVALAGHANPCMAAYIDADTVKITQRVFLDVQIGDKSTPPQRIVIGLFGEATPRLVENFTTLCRQNAYAGTTFYRVLSDYSIQGGAIGDISGKSGKSASGNAVLEPDNFDILHNKAGLVSMVRNMGVGLVDSRFFITCANDAGWADDRYAAFGIVEEGSMNVVHDIEKVKVKPPQNSPTVPVQIVASGVLS
jgi:cyclophilin family peptidyl-prolyl cis-trans isomerase